MFKQLTNLGYDRSPLQAFGFYLVYLLFGLLAAGLLGMFLGAAGGGFDAGVRIGAIFALIVTPTLAFFVCKAKKNLKSFVSILLILLSALVAFLIGFLGGLVVVAILTTHKSKVEANYNPVEPFS